MSKLKFSKYAAKVHSGGSKYWHKNRASLDEQNRQCAILQNNDAESGHFWGRTHKQF